MKRKRTKDSKEKALVIEQLVDRLWMDHSLLDYRAMDMPGLLFPPVNVHVNEKLKTSEAFEVSAAFRVRERSHAREVQLQSQ